MRRQREHRGSTAAELGGREGGVSYFLVVEFSVVRFRFWTSQRGLVWIKNKAFVDIYLPTPIRTL